MEKACPLEPDVGVVETELLPRVLAGSDRGGELVHLKKERSEERRVTGEKAYRVKKKRCSTTAAGRREGCMHV